MTLSLNQYIDHTLLRPEASESEIRELCHQAKEFRFKAVCVEAKWLPIVVPLLENSGVLPITVVGFPGGNAPTLQKKAETEHAVKIGAKEIDMVLNRELLSAKRYSEVLADIAAVVQMSRGLPVKVILETSELHDEEKIIACALTKAAGASYVKTSTGFSRGGATVEDISLMRRVVGPDFGVKASGGVRTREDALKMIQAGATRLGTSAGVTLVQGNIAQSGGY